MDLRVKTKKVEISPAPPLRLGQRQNERPHFFREEEHQGYPLKNSSNILSRAFASLLVGFFLLNPLLDVYADELPIIPLNETEAPLPVVAPVPSPELSVETSSPEIVLPPEPEATVATVSDEPQPATTTEQSTQTTEQAQVNEEIREQAATTTATATSNEGEEEKAAAEVIEELATTTSELPAMHNEESATSTESSSASSTAAVPENTSETASDEAVTEEPKTNEESEVSDPQEQNSAQLPQAQIVNVVEQKYLFRENECTRLDDGAFYCAPPTASSTSVSNLSLPRVYVESDAKNKGSKEIFFEDANGKVQLTDNDTDDDAPAYDKQSGFIVWHSLVKGRFQIMLYDRNSSTTRQLTGTDYNNTDPKVRGKSLAWQGWVNNNWEIFYIKDVTEEPLKISQITSNSQPDMFPIISDDFITWQSFFDGSWHVSVYNIQNGEISQISQPEAGKYENPRFALLFENRKENGEVETVGYDVASGKEIPINAPHTQVPTPSPQEEKDQAVPVPSGQTGTSTSPLKNPGKDDEGHEA